MTVVICKQRLQKTVSAVHSVIQNEHGYFVAFTNIRPSDQILDPFDLVPVLLFLSAKAVTGLEFVLLLWLSLLSVFCRLASGPPIALGATTRFLTPSSTSSRSNQ
jgi:hypothetical protein